MFQGFAEQDDVLPVVFLVKDQNGTPINLDALPTFRVYGPDGFITGQSGSGSFRDSGSVTDATNATPVVITSASHGLETGDRVTITNVVGNTGANGTFTVTKLGSTSFSLVGSVGDGAYVSGGQWNVTGLYAATLTVSGNNGYDQGNTYEVLLEGAISTTPYADMASFGVT